MIKIILIILVLLLLFYYFSTTNNEKFENGKNTKIVLYQDYRGEDPGYIYDSPEKRDTWLNINLKSAYVKTHDKRVEIWRIWDSPNSNSTSINSDFYSYLSGGKRGMSANPAKYQLMALIEPNSEQKIDFKDQINRIRLIIY